MKNNWRSKFHLTPEGYKHFVASLSAETRSIVENPEATTSEMHRAIVDYSISMQMWNTAVRPVNDLFCMPHEIDYDLQLALLADKVAHESHAYRISPLTQVTCDQGHAYQKRHLISLAKVIYDKGDSLGLAKAINGLSEGKNNTGLPLFFYINDELSQTYSITYSDIEKLWQRHLKGIPVNCARHYLPTELEARGIAPYLISAFLGHGYVTEHPFGRLSEIAIHDACSQLRTAISETMEDAGWAVIQGIKPRKGTNLDRLARKKNVIPHVHEKPIFGSAERKLKRDAKKRKRNKLITDVIAKYTSDISVLSSEKIEQMVTELISQLEQGEHSVYESLLIFYRLLSGLEKKGLTVDKFKKIIPLKQDRSPFSSSYLVALKESHRLQRNFIDLLTMRNQSGRERSYLTNVAELIVSAALFGGLSEPEILENLPYSVPNKTYRIGEINWVELFITDPEERYKFIGRWIPDNLSLLFILSLHRCKEKEFSPKDLESEIRKLMLELGFSRGEEPPIFETLASAGKTIFIHYAPGYLCHANSKLGWQTSLPPHVFYRVFSGQKLLIPDSPTDLNIEQAPGIVSPKKTLAETKFKNLITKLINTAQNTAAISNRRRRTAIMRTFVSLLEEHEKEIGEYPIYLQLLYWWLLTCLSKRKVGRGRPIKLKTLRDAFFSVANPIMAISPKDDLREYSSEQFELLYERVIEASNEQNQSRPKRNTKDFHKFLVKRWGVEIPEWGAIGFGENDEFELANANYLTQNEYLSIVNSIYSENASINALNAACSVVLGYRFGLRWGEVRELLGENFQYSDDLTLIFLQIQNTVYGERKTIASVRQVPLLSKLTKPEKKILKRAIFEFESRLSPDHNSLLLGVERAFFDETKIRSLINTAFLSVTGDRTLQFHHLRHTFLTNLGSIATDCHHWNTFKDHLFDFDTDEKMGLRIWNESTQKYCRLATVSELAGHSSSTTTNTHYIHLIEFLRRQYVSRFSNQLPSSVVYYACGENIESLKKRKSRSNGNTLIEVACSHTNIINQDVRYQSKLSRGRPKKSDGNVKPYLTVNEICKVLQLLEIRSSLRGIADITNLTNEKIMAIANQALLLSADTAIPFKSSAITADLIQQERNGSLFHSLNDRENRLLKSFVEAFDALYINYSDDDFLAIQKFINLWRSRVVPSSGHIHITSKGELDDVISGLLVMRDHLEFSICYKPLQPTFGRRLLDDLANITNAKKVKISASEIDRLPRRDLAFGYGAQISPVFCVVSMKNGRHKARLVDVIFFCLGIYLNCLSDHNFESGS